MIKFFSIFHHGKRTRGQSMVEFALSLPVLLLLIMGIVEFARILHAFLAVQNAARFGMRYATSGEYNPAYCVDSDSSGKACDTDVEQDAARLPSIRDATIAAAAGVWHNTTLTNQATDWNRPGYLSVVICSTRKRDPKKAFNNDALSADYNPLIFKTYKTPRSDGRVEPVSNTPNDWVLAEDCRRQWSYGGSPPAWTSTNVHEEDGGGPGDRVIVMVRFNHPLITPFVSQMWQQLTLRADREGIVERFRIAAVEGISPQFVPDTKTFTPTSTFTPSNTPTNTHTPTYTFTPSNTPTNTSTATKTFTPTSTATRTNTATRTPTSTPTTTATPYCGGLATDPAYTEPVLFRGTGGNDNIDIPLKSNYAIGNITVTGMTVFWNGVWNYHLYSGGSFVQQPMPAVSLDYYRWRNSSGSDTDYNPSNVALPTNGASFTQTVTFTTQPTLVPSDTALLTIDFTQNFTASNGFRHLHHAIDWTMTVNYTAGGLSCSANFTGLDGPSLTVTNPPTGTIGGTFPNVQASGADANGITDIKFEVYDASTGTIVGSRSDSSSPYCFVSGCTGITINGTNAWPNGSTIVDGTYYMLVEIQDNDPHDQYTIQRFDFVISGAPTQTPTRTPTSTNTSTRTNTPTNTFTPSNTPTITRTPTITNTPTRTNTPTITRTPTITNTATRTYTPSNTATRTNTSTRTNTPTITNTPTRTFTPSNTATRTATFTRTNTSTASNTPTNTKTFTPTFTPTNTPTRTNTPTAAPASPTRTPTPTPTFGAG